MTELSPEQDAVLADGVRVVEAAPGAGKTRALISRFVVRASRSSRGIALLSFTNAAVNEARRRCVGRPELLRSPHFIGTIDSFLHRFLVTPVEAQRLGRLPRYVSSWDDLDERFSVVRLQSVPGIGVRLDAFALTPAGTAQLVARRVRHGPEAGWVGQVSQQGKLPQLETRATAVMTSLIQRGVLDAASARFRATQMLAAEDSEHILGRLAARFEEVLVDEAQDCDAGEFEIWRRLTTAGIEVLVVADPDQAVFEFRGGDPAQFLAYRDEHAAEERAALTVNFRSSTQICSAVTVLRGAGLHAVVASDASPCAPIYLLQGTAGEVAQKFAALLDEHNLSAGQAMVVSHRRSDAQNVCGTADTPKSGAAGNRIAIALRELEAADPGRRLKAITSIESILVGFVPSDDATEVASNEDKLAALDVDPRWLRKAAADFVATLREVDDRAAFGVSARAAVARLLNSISVPVPANLGARLAKPTEEVWTWRCGDAVPVMLASNTIHGVKGMEFPAVLVVLQPTLPKVDGLDVLDDVAQGRNTEARRVLYVGASRAESLLAFAAGPNTQRLAALFEAGGVTAEVR